LQGLVAAATAAATAVAATAGAIATTTAVAAAAGASATTAAAVAATAGAVTATATTVTATTTETTGARRTCLHRTGFVHSDAAATQRLTVHASDSGLGFGIAAHFHKTETFRAACVALHHDFGAGDGAEFAESLLQVFVANGVRQVADVNKTSHLR